MRSLSLYRPTQTTPCGYLPNHWSRSDYVDPRVALTTEELTQLNRLGFRRSGQLLYRPACPDCNACESARFEPLKLRINRRLKRAIKYCRPFHLAVETAHCSDEHYRLYRAYINARHRDGAMYPPSQQQYEEFITSHFGNTAFLTLRCGEQLIGCLVFDLLQDGVSSVYCYFDTHYEHCSPGRYLIYSLSAIAIALKLPYHYLGYYIDNCKKMTYKAEWQPLDLLQNGVWQAKS